MIKPLPNSEVYPLTPEARLETYLSKYQEGFGRDLKEFLGRYRGEAIGRTFYIDLMRDLKDFLKISFDRQGGSKIRYDCYRANDKIIITISYGLDWTIVHHVQIYD